MTSEIPPSGTAQRDEFARQFASTPRAARLARRLAVDHLDSWGCPPGSDLSHSVALLVAELTANAV